MHQKPTNAHHALRVSMHVKVLWGLFLDQCFQCPSARPTNFMIYSHTKQCTMLPMTWEWCSVLPLWRDKRRRRTRAHQHEQSFSYQVQLFCYSNSFQIARISLFRKSPRESNKQDHTINCQSATIANNTKGMSNSLESRANKALHQEIRPNPKENFNLGAVIGLNATGRCGGWGNLVRGR